MTIQTIAKEMHNNFELAKRENGSEFYRTKEDIDWQRDIIHKAHGDKMPDDDVYNRIDTLNGLKQRTVSRHSHKLNIYTYKRSATSY